MACAVACTKNPQHLMVVKGSYEAKFRKGYDKISYLPDS